MTLESKLTYPSCTSEESKVRETALRERYITALGRLEQAVKVGDPQDTSIEHYDGVDLPENSLWDIEASWSRTFSFMDKTGNSRQLTIEYHEGQAIPADEADEEGVKGLLPDADKPWFNRGYTLKEGEDVLMLGQVRYGSNKGQVDSVTIDDFVEGEYEEDSGTYDLRAESVVALEEVLDHL